MKRSLLDVYVLTLIACLIIVAVLIAGCGDEYEREIATPAERVVTQPAETVTVPPTEEPVSKPGTPSEHSEFELTEGEREMVRGAAPAAREFLAGYLLYTYGKLPAKRIRHTTMALRRRLDRDAPRVPAGTKPKARVERLEPSGFLEDRVIILATVKDGRTTYPVSLTLEDRNDRWIVVEAR